MISETYNHLVGRSKTLTHPAEPVTNLPPDSAQMFGTKALTLDDQRRWSAVFTSRTLEGDHQKSFQAVVVL